MIPSLLTFTVYHIVILTSLSASLNPLSINNKKFKLPEFGIINEIKDIFTGNNHKIKKFRDYSRQYNNTLLFALLDLNIKLPPEYGSYCLRLLRVGHHKTSSSYDSSSAVNCEIRYCNINFWEEVISLDAKSFELHS